MSKSVLVMDTPENCRSCMYIGTFHSFCKINCRDIKDVSVKPLGVRLWIYQRKTMEIIHLIHLTQDLQKDGMSVLMRLQEEILMIDLTGKSVFVKTQEEYLSILKIAKFQGFTWTRVTHLNPVEIQLPNILNFYSSKMVTCRDDRNALYEASEIVEDEEKLKDAVNLVRTFAKYPDRTALTDSFIESLKLLADTVESQMSEVK